MKLSGQQVKQIQDALLDAYATRDSLRIMVRTGLDQSLDAIADGQNLQVVIFNLVSWAEQYGRVRDLLSAAQSQNPGNESLQQLVKAPEFTPRPSTPSTTPSTLPVIEAAIPPASVPSSVDVFLSYSRRDIDAMQVAREALRATGLVVWTDEGLEPGTPSWRSAIEEAIRQSKAMVALLSPNANVSVWVDNEVAYAQALGKRVFPILVGGDEGSAVPINLIRVQWLDGRKDLQRVIEQELQPHLLRQIGVAVAPANPILGLQWIMIPAGEFIMGSDGRTDARATSDEMPRHRLVLPSFYISRYPVTNAQYGRFVAATGYACPSHWAGGHVPSGREDHPVVNVGWYDAQAFCDWSGVLLPSEAQWEKAARGRDGRLYPWGSEEPQASRCNCDRRLEDTAPVGTCADGDSPYGAADMAGNVLEWTRSLWGTQVATPEYTYPYAAGDGREDPNADRKMLRVLRGGAFNLGARCVRCAFRTNGAPSRGRPNIGFRVVWSESGRVGAR
ncbi:MAG: SUMF1/EgtB/PvdO family nonheme iron enzyme [Caldilineaceae bacterium]